MEETASVSVGQAGLEEPSAEIAVKESDDETSKLSEEVQQYKSEQDTSIESENLSKPTHIAWNLEQENGMDGANDQNERQGQNKGSYVSQDEDSEIFDKATDGNKDAEQKVDIKEMSTGPMDLTGTKPEQEFNDLRVGEKSRVEDELHEKDQAVCEQASCGNEMVTSKVVIDVKNSSSSEIDLAATAAQESRTVHENRTEESEMTTTELSMEKTDLCGPFTEREMPEEMASSQEITLSTKETLQRSQQPSETKHHISTYNVDIDCNVEAKLKTSKSECRADGGRHAKLDGGSDTSSSSSPTKSKSPKKKKSFPIKNSLAAFIAERLLNRTAEESDSDEDDEKETDRKVKTNTNVEGKDETKWDVDGEDKSQTSDRLEKVSNDVEEPLSHTTHSEPSVNMEKFSPSPTAKSEPLVCLEKSSPSDTLKSDPSVNMETVSLSSTPKPGCSPVKASVSGMSLLGEYSSSDDEMDEEDSSTQTGSKATWKMEEEACSMKPDTQDISQMEEDSPTKLDAKVTSEMEEEDCSTKIGTEVTSKLNEAYCSTKQDMESTSKSNVVSSQSSCAQVVGPQYSHSVSLHSLTGLALLCPDGTVTTYQASALTTAERSEPNVEEAVSPPPSLEESVSPPPSLEESVSPPPSLETTVLKEESVPKVVEDTSSVLVREKREGNVEASVFIQSDGHVIEEVTPSIVEDTVETSVVPSDSHLIEKVTQSVQETNVQTSVVPPCDGHVIEEVAHQVVENSVETFVVTPPIVESCVDTSDQSLVFSTEESHQTIPKCLKDQNEVSENTGGALQESQPVGGEEKSVLTAGDVSIPTDDKMIKQSTIEGVVLEEVGSAESMQEESCHRNMETANDLHNQIEEVQIQLSGQEERRLENVFEKQDDSLPSTADKVLSPEADGSVRTEGQTDISNTEMTSKKGGNGVIEVCEEPDPTRAVLADSQHLEEHDSGDENTESKEESYTDIEEIVVLLPMDGETSDDKESANVEGLDGASMTPLAGTDSQCDLPLTGQDSEALTDCDVPLPHSAGGSQLALASGSKGSNGSHKLERIEPIQTVTEESKGSNEAVLAAGKEDFNKSTNEVETDVDTHGADLSEDVTSCSPELSKSTSKDSEESLSVKQTGGGHTDQTLADNEVLFAGIEDDDEGDDLCVESPCNDGETQDDIGNETELPDVASEAKEEDVSSQSTAASDPHLNTETGGESSKHDLTSKEKSEANSPVCNAIEPVLFGNDPWLEREAQDEDGPNQGESQTVTEESDDQNQPHGLHSHGLHIEVELKQTNRKHTEKESPTAGHVLEEAKTPVKSMVEEKDTQLMPGDKGKQPVVAEKGTQRMPGNKGKQPVVAEKGTQRMPSDEEVDDYDLVIEVDKSTRNCVITKPESHPLYQKVEPRASYSRNKTNQNVVPAPAKTKYVVLQKHTESSEAAPQNEASAKGVKKAEKEASDNWLEEEGSPRARSRVTKVPKKPPRGKTETPFTWDLEDSPEKTPASGDVTAVDISASNLSPGNNSSPQYGVSLVTKTKGSPLGVTGDSASRPRVRKRTPSQVDTGHPPNKTAKRGSSHTELLTASRPVKDTPLVKPSKEFPLVRSAKQQTALVAPGQPHSPIPNPSPDHQVTTQLTTLEPTEHTDNTMITVDDEISFKKRKRGRPKKLQDSILSLPGTAKAPSIDMSVPLKSATDPTVRQRMAVKRPDSNLPLDNKKRSRLSLGEAVSPKWVKAGLIKRSESPASEPSTPSTNDASVPSTRSSEAAKKKVPRNPKANFVRKGSPHIPVCNSKTNSPHSLKRSSFAKVTDGTKTSRQGSVEPTPSSKAQMKTPTASPNINVKTPMPSPNLQLKTPTPSPKVNSKTPISTPKVNVKTPTPSPKVKIKAPTPSPKFNLKMPTPSPKVKVKAPMPSPKVKVNKTSAPSPKLKVKTPTTSPKVKVKTPTPSPKVKVKTPKQSPKVKVKTPTASPSLSSSGKTGLAQAGTKRKSQSTPTVGAKVKASAKAAPKTNPVKPRKGPSVSTKRIAGKPKGSVKGAKSALNKAKKLGKKKDVKPALAKVKQKQKSGSLKKQA